MVSQPDKPAGRGSQLTAPAVKVAALELGLPVIQPRSARTGELRDALVASGAELAVVVAYGKILPRAVLEALPRGCINVHASILPSYRGAAPVQWAVIDGDPETGVAIMQLDEGMDTGPVLLERRVDDRSATRPRASCSPGSRRSAPPRCSRRSRRSPAARRGPCRRITPPRPTPRCCTKSDGAIDFAQPAHAVARADPRRRSVAGRAGDAARADRQAVPRVGPRAAAGCERCRAPCSRSMATALHVACGDGRRGDPRDPGAGAQADGRRRSSRPGAGIAVGDVLAQADVEPA